MIVDAAHLSVGDTLLRTVVVALGTFGHLKASRLAVAAKIGLTGGVDEVHPIDVHEIVVEAHGQRVGLGHKATLAVGQHIILLAADVDHHLTGLWSLNAEVGAALLVNLGEFVAGDGILYRHGIGRHLYLLGHLDEGTLGLETQVAGHGLTVATAQLTIASSIEVQAVGAVAAVV